MIMDPIKMQWLIVLVFGIILDATEAQIIRGCPPQDNILPCRCLLKEKEYQIWCSHSDLPRVLDGIKAIGQHISQPIDELILENNNLPSLPGKTFLPLKVMRLMLRYNSLERVSDGWLSGLEDSLMELFVVEPHLRTIPEESLHNMNALEAVTIQTTLTKRLPKFSNLQKLRYIQIESVNLVELSPLSFRNLPRLKRVHIGGSPRLERLEAETFQDLPQLQILNISHCGLSWIHLRSIRRLPVLTELSLIGNKISDAGMIGRSSLDLPALEILRLDYNEISKIGEAAFVDLSSLKKLYLSNNRITELHHGAFHRVPKLTTLDLSNNAVRSVHPESFLQHSGSGIEELWLMHNEINHIAELRSLLDALPRLIFLDMSHNNLEAIPYGALHGHATLEELYLDYNKIRVIEKEAFMTMPALRELRMKNNSLSDLSEAPFWNLPALKGLDMSANFYRRIDSKLFTNIPSLRKLDLSFNEIHVVDPETFLLTPQLEHINLSHNALSSLHPATFQHLMGLYELDVTNNGLRKFVPGLPRSIEYLYMGINQILNIPFPPSAYLDLPALKKLDLSSNGIQGIPATSLNTLPNLKKLHIGKNALRQLEERSLAGLNNLEVLDLRENRISKIHPYALKELRYLTELNLRKNRLDVIVPDLFHGLSNLKKLDISRNLLTEIISGTLNETKNLEEMDVSRNALVFLPPGLNGLKKLKILDLTNNRLKNIPPDTLNSLVSLEELKISRNYVQEIRTGAFENLAQLKVLFLDNNDLISMETKTFRALPYLKLIKLSQNRLQEIPNAAFSDLPLLQMLELQENELKLIASGAFHQTPQLLMLNISHNQIVGLEDAGLASLRSLEMLDISSNQLSVVASPSLQRMEWLVELRLDNNKICSVHGPTFNSMPRLRVLSLRNNKMMTFPEHAVQKLRGNIAVLDIDGNPLACKCSLLWLRAWLQEQSVMGPRCMDGTLLREVRLSRQDCLQEEKYNEPVALGCETELLSLPAAYATEQVYTNQWGQIRDNKTKLSPNNKNKLPPSPEESDYFYEDYIDYPFNDTIDQNALHVKDVNSSHFLAGDTPVFYAATNNNKIKHTDTPKGVVGSPSSSGFTFFGLPLPSINLNNILTNTLRNDKKKALTLDATVNAAERKTAIVNKPARLPEIKPEIRPLRHPPDLPERHNIIGMLPPSYPVIETGGFVPIVPGQTGGFKPMIFNQPQDKNSTTTVEIEKLNVTQITSSSIQKVNAIDPNEQLQSTPSFLSKRGPSLSQTIEIVTNPAIINKTQVAESIIIENPEAGEEEDDEYEEEDEQSPEDEVTTKSAIRINEIEHIKNISQMLSFPKPTKTTVEIETSSNSGATSFEDLFKEVVENVSLAPQLTNIENTTVPIESNQTDLITSFSNDNQQASISVHDKKEVIGTPLSALLIPGGQQPQFRPSGRPTIMKVQSPHTSASTPLLSQMAPQDDEIVPMAHYREGKNTYDTTAMTSVTNDNMSWYFANYNKTNLEPYVSPGMYEANNVGIKTSNLMYLFVGLYNMLY